MKKIILEGCNGYWAQKHYLPFLIKKVVDYNFELWAIDIQANIKLQEPQVKLWTLAENQGKANYLNKEKNEKYYKQLSDASFVFVTAPDKFHCEIAEFWLNRLSKDGKIFIEKPLDASIRSAEKLRNKLRKKDNVYGFSHYLARSHPFLKNKDFFLKKIGEIRKIEFYILESSEIHQNRAASLEKGIISDLFCHVLSVLNAMNVGTLSLENIRIEEVKTARCAEAPIQNETFAWIKFNYGNIEIESAVGKYIGKSDRKFMKIIGSKGLIELNFLKDEFVINSASGNKEYFGKLNPRHVENFLEKILKGSEPLNAPGVLSFDDAFEILLILERVKEAAAEMHNYKAQEELDEILERF